MKDNYEILGVSSTAEHQAIKKAYRQLVLKYHPDRNPGNEFTAAQFREVQEAYDVLSDPIKKARYDEDRWLGGFGRKTDTRAAASPAWLLSVCIQLNKDLLAMDTYRMSHNALRTYMLLILSDAHIGILQQAGDQEAVRLITDELLAALHKLDRAYRPQVAERLLLLASINPDAAVVIKERLAAWEKENVRARLLPYFVIVVTLSLCLLMYLYGRL